MISFDRLREYLNYDPLSGTFTHLTDHPLWHFRQGDMAGGTDSSGYVIVGVDGRRYKAHRLAWLFMTGEWPQDCIDHRNGIRDDNRFENLRDVSSRENNTNKAAHRSGKLPGVTFQPRREKPWRSRITLDGKQRYLGNFRTAEEAFGAYQSAVSEMEAAR
jgi:HNH endonuclease